MLLPAEAGPQETQETQGGGGGRAGPTRQVGLEDSEEGNELRAPSVSRGASPDRMGRAVRHPRPPKPRVRLDVRSQCAWRPSTMGWRTRTAGPRAPRAASRTPARPRFRVRRPQRRREKSQPAGAQGPPGARTHGSRRTYLTGGASGLPPLLGAARSSSYGHLEPGPRTAARHGGRRGRSAPPRPPQAQGVRAGPRTPPLRPESAGRHEVPSWSRGTVQAQPQLPSRILEIPRGLRATPQPPGAMERASRGEPRASPRRESGSQGTGQCSKSPFLLLSYSFR